MVSERQSRAALALAAVLGAAACTSGAQPPVGGDEVDAAVGKLDAAVLDAPGDIPRRDAPPAPSPPGGPIAPWTGKDVGAVMPRGEARASASLLTVRAGGTDIGGAADGFHFVSQKVRGDFELMARVRSLQLVDPETKAGVMVRANDTEPGAANVFLAVLGDPMKGGLFQQRAAAGGPTVAGGVDAGVRANQWLRITRKGRTFTAFRSATRLGWVKVGSADLDLPPEVSAGVAVAAKSAAAATTAEIDGLRLQSLDSQPATKDWGLEELGSVMGGSAVYAPAGGLALSGLGETFSLLSESGLFAYQSASGNQTLIVRVAALAHRDPIARLGLMVREGPPVVFSRTQPAAIISVTVGMGVQFQSRGANNMMATVAPLKDGLKAPVWLRLDRIEEPGPPVSSRFTGSYSDDGRTWIPVGSAVFSLPEPYLIGVVLNSNGGSTPVTATLTDVSLGSAAPAPPPPPPPPPPADAGRADAGGDGRL
jgi:hypothetical protein